MRQIKRAGGVTAALAGAFALLLGGLTAPAWAGGTASPPADECVPQDAWTEVIEHPAQGEEFIEVIDTEAWTEVIEHPAVYEEVEHEAVYAVEREYRKQVRGVVEQRDNGKNKRWHRTGKTFDWTWWEPASTRWSEEDVEALQSGPHNGVVKEWTEGNGHKRWRWVSTEYRYVQTGETRQGRMLKEPWTERVLVKDAWIEVIEHEATYKTVENPDYVPAWTETIEHPAVECPSEEPTVDKWDLTIAVTCEAVTFSHLRFKQSFDPEYRVDVNGEQGERLPYTWGETVTIPAPDDEVSTTWEVRIFAKNPDLGGAYQQIGARKVVSEDCETGDDESTGGETDEETGEEPGQDTDEETTDEETDDESRDEEPRNPDTGREPKREREVLFKHKTCDGVFERYVLWEYPADGGERIGIEHGDEKVRDLTVEEAERLGCIETPPPPKEEPKEEPREELAETGVNPLVAILTALGMTGTGAALLVARSRKRAGLR